MAEAVTFWLDNKKAVGTKAASIGDQLLVNYRNRFYLVADGAAVVKGSKALRYSQSSLPADWKMILREETAANGVCAAGSPSAELVKPRKPPVKKIIEIEEPVMPEPIPVELPCVVPEKKPKQSRKEPKAVSEAAPSIEAATVSNTAVNTSVPTTVPVECPYCSQKQDISVEKGIDGKPFFQNCAKCLGDFAVRFVAVTTYQAQVAGFR